MTAFPSSLFTKHSAGASDTLSAFGHSTNHNNIQDEIVAIETKLGIDNSAVDTTLDYFMRTGWLGCSETFVYASADSPTFTMTVAGSDVTSKYPVGTKFWLTQTTSKYFIVTKVAFSTDTTITLYGGTDYTLANAAITSPRFSRMKSPTGFPLDPDKWTASTVNTSDVTQASPVDGTWYNLGSISLSVPIGVWKLKYAVTVQVGRTGTNTANTFVSLSTANNTRGVEPLTAGVYATGASANITLRLPIFREDIVSLTSKTSYYLNVMGSGFVNDAVYFVGSTSSGHATTIEAISSYL